MKHQFITLRCRTPDGDDYYSLKSVVVDRADDNGFLIIDSLETIYEGVTKQELVDALAEMIASTGNVVDEDNFWERYSY